MQSLWVIDLSYGNTTLGVCWVLPANQLVTKVKSKPTCGYHFESSLKIFLKQGNFLQFIKTSFWKPAKIFDIYYQEQTLCHFCGWTQWEKHDFLHSSSSISFILPSLNREADFLWFFVVIVLLRVSISVCACQVSVSLDNLKLKLQLDIEIFQCAIFLMQ